MNQAIMFLGKYSEVHNSENQTCYLQIKLNVTSEIYSLFREFSYNNTICKMVIRGKKRKSFSSFKINLGTSDKNTSY